MQERRVFIPLLNFSQQIQGVGGGRKVHICSTLPAFACCRRAAPILCRTTDKWMFLSIYYFFAAWLLTLQQKDQLRLPASLREMFDGIDPAASVWQAAGDSVGLFSAFSSCYMAAVQPPG